MMLDSKLIQFPNGLKGLVKVEHDDQAADPRKDFDHVATMYCFHPRYKLGDEHGYDDPTMLAKTVNNKTHYLLPLYLYDHSGITISTEPFSCVWDSGQVGVIAIHKDHAATEWEEDTERRAFACMRAEVEEYDHYLTGQVYGYTAELDLDGETIDEESCWGYYGADALAMEEGESCLRSMAESYFKQYGEQLELPLS